MARLYHVGQKGTSFGGRLSNIDDPDNPMPQDLRDSAAIMIIFEKPDGSKIEKIAEFEDDNATLADGAEIVYTDNDATEPSFLDQAGRWLYTPAIRFQNGNYIVSPYKDSFYATD